MNKKLLVGGAVAGLAGIAAFKIISQQNNKRKAMRVNWTTADIPDLNGRVIIVTGANSGVGYEAAKEFARKGAQTILACRNMDKAQSALDTILQEIPDARAEIMQLDVASLTSVESFADAFKAKYDRLDVLVNNAGIMMVPYGLTEDNFESQFGTNHLGHFALTGLLIDLLLNTSHSRVVNVSSNAHNRGSVDFDNLMYENGNYGSQDAYARSKLANILFTNELQSRFEAIDADAIAVAAHPGISNTGLADHMLDNRPGRMARPLMAVMTQSAAMGALPTLRAAVDPNVQGGDYYGPDGYRSMRGYPIKIPTSAAAQHAEDAGKLWQISTELTGVNYESLGEIA